MKLFKFYKNRINYWSCSKFADWIRGSNKPSAATMEGWKEWKQFEQKNNSFRYWLAEELLDNIQDVVCYPYDVFRFLKSRIKNRFIYKEYALISKLPKWDYYDLDTRILYCLFDALVDFVETEKAHMQLLNEDKCRTVRLLSKSRKSELGLKYLEWESSLVDDYGKLTHQVENAKTITKLYMWWKYERPNRPDGYEANGFYNLDDYKSMISDDFEKVNKTEKMYDKEDEDMLIELIKIRKSLWT